MYIDQNERRAGVGRRLYAALLPILTQQGFRSVCAGISLPNAGSVGLHEGLGFNHIGTFPEVGYKLGKWHDVGYWRFELSGGSKPPNEYVRTRRMMFAAAQIGFRNLLYVDSGR